MFGLYVRFENEEKIVFGRTQRYNIRDYKCVCACLECLCYEILLCVRCTFPSAVSSSSSYDSFSTFFWLSLPHLFFSASLPHRPLRPSSQVRICSVLWKHVHVGISAVPFLHSFSFTWFHFSIFICWQIYMFLFGRALFPIDCFNHILGLHIIVSILIHFKYTKISSADEVAVCHWQSGSKLEKKRKKEKN